MSTLFILTMIAAFSVIAVLVLGILSMLKGGDLNKKYGNKLMMARVGLQAVAILLLMTLWIMSSK
jgi:hypothetical protein